jgi:HrpA-like RNA helicase
MRWVAQALEESPKLRGNRYSILPLHSMIPAHEQRKVFQVSRCSRRTPPPRSTRAWKTRQAADTPD